MINEKLLNENEYSNIKIYFTVTLLKTLFSLKENKNIDDIYLNPNIDKLEIYIFTFKEDFETEDFITKTMVEWEQSQRCFPEFYINKSDDGKMNILPRGAMKIC